MQACTYSSELLDKTKPPSLFSTAQLPLHKNVKKLTYLFISLIINSLVCFTIPPRQKIKKHDKYECYINIKLHLLFSFVATLIPLCYYRSRRQATECDPALRQPCVSLSIALHRAGSPFPPLPYCIRFRFSFVLFSPCFKLFLYFFSFLFL